MATTTSTGNIETYLGAKGRIFSRIQDAENLEGPAASSRSRFCRSHLRRIESKCPRAHQSSAHLWPRAPRAAPAIVSILPVDQGIEHSAGASFAKNPDYFDAENIVKLAIEGGCNAVASTFGVLGAVARKYAHKIPFIVKLNHNELLTYPNKFDQIFFGTVQEAWNMGAAAVGATIYFGSDQADRQIVEVSRAFAEAHELGMATVLWCYLRNNAFKKGQGLPPLRRPDRPGQSSRRHHPGRHHQAKTARK